MQTWIAIQIYTWWWDSIIVKVMSSFSIIRQFWKEWHFNFKGWKKYNALPNWMPIFQSAILKWCQNPFKTLIHKWVLQKYFRKNICCYIYENLNWFLIDTSTLNQKSITFLCYPKMSVVKSKIVSKYILYVAMSGLIPLPLVPINISGFRKLFWKEMRMK